jgi:hypothetical protein
VTTDRERSLGQQGVVGVILSYDRYVELSEDMVWDYPIEFTVIEAHILLTLVGLGYKAKWVSDEHGVFTDDTDPSLAELFTILASIEQKISEALSP